MSFSCGGTEAFRADITPVTAAPFTVAGWGYCTNATSFQVVWSSGDTSVNNDYWFLAFSGNVAGDPIEFVARNTATQSAQTTTGYSLNTWHHVCAVETTSSSRSVYIDGGSKATNSVAQTPTPTATALGRLERLSPTAFHNGRLGEFGLWSVALSDDQVRMLAAGASPFMVRPDALVAYWPGYRVSSLIDYSGQGNDLSTVVGSPSIADHAPVAPQWGFNTILPYAVAAPPAGAVMNQLQSSNIGADLYNGTIQ